MEGDPRASRGPSHSSERPRSKHRAPSPPPGPHLGAWSEEGRAGHPEPPGGRGPSPPRGAGAPWMSAVHRPAPALAYEAPRRPAEGRLAAPADRLLGAPQARGQHPPSHKDHPPLRAQGQEEPSAGSAQRPRPASAGEESPRPLCREGTAGKLCSRGVPKGKGRGGRSSRAPTPPSEVASHNPEKQRKRRRSGATQSHRCERRPHGFHAGAGPGGLPPRVREKVGATTRTPEGKVRTPPLGRKPAGRRLEEEEELQPPAMSFQAGVIHDPRPSQVASAHPTLPWLAGAPGMSGAPPEAASENPMAKRERKHSSQSQSHKDQRRLRGFDAGAGPGGLLPTVREKAGGAGRPPEGRVRTPHLGRKPAGAPPEAEEELDRPIVSSEASLTPHQPPARKERQSVERPATALGGKSPRKEDRTRARAEAGQSETPFPPAAARARPPRVPPAATPAWPDRGPCRGQPSDPPLPAFASMSSFQPGPRAPPSPGEEEGAGLMGVRLHSGTQAFAGSNRARRRRMITMLQHCLQTLQDSVALLSHVRGVPCSPLQPAVGGYTPERRPRLEEHQGAPAAETEPLWKKQRHRALEKERWEGRTSQLQPQEQEVPERALHISANRPQDPPANMAFSDSSERGGAAAVQEKALLAPDPTAGTRAPSHPASGHSCRPIPGKQVVSSHRKPVKKTAPLMAKSIKDYKTWCYRR